jgi:hypothetical protein
MTRNLTASKIYRRKSTQPYIRLAGKYLRAAGITPGTRLVVAITAQGVTITPKAA